MRIRYIFSSGETVESTNNTTLEFFAQGVEDCLKYGEIVDIQFIEE